jgi:hypothetical protein
MCSAYSAKNGYYRIPWVNALRAYDHQANWIADFQSAKMNKKMFDDSTDLSDGSARLRDEYHYQ